MTTIGDLRRSATAATFYAAATRRILPRGGRTIGARLAPAEERLVFVVGSPRSGTTFLGEALGGLPGFVDLGEVKPLKAIVPELVALREEEAAVRVRRVLERTRRLALVRGLRAVEQTPEMAFLVGAALRAYPRARVVHLVRDGRDVVCSLLERGWLRAGKGGRDDAGHAYGAGTRFWVEADRTGEFATVSDATRAAWAWRRYLEAARAHGERTIEVRYELLVADPEQAAAVLAPELDVARDVLATRLAGGHTRSVGRYREDLTAEQLADVEREAGALLRDLGYSG